MAHAVRTLHARLFGGFGDLWGLGSARKLAWSASFVALALVRCGGAAPPEPIDGGGPFVGSLAIEWKIVDRNGVEHSCAEFSATEVVVSLGGLQKQASCDAGSVTYEGLLADRYPVIAQLRSQAVVRAEARTNAVVVAGQLAVATVVFDIESSGGIGGARIRWRIDGRPAETECASVGASRVNLVSQTGSTAPIDEVAPCPLGELLIGNLPVGSYALILRLEKPDQTRIASAIVPAFRVTKDGVVEPPIANIVTRVGPRTKILGLFTINSSAAADACDTILGRTVKFTTVPRPPQVATSTIVDCRTGRAVLDHGLGTETYKVRFELEYSLLKTATVTVDGVQVIQGRTTTVSADIVAR